MERPLKIQARKPGSEPLRRPAKKDLTKIRETNNFLKVAVPLAQMGREFYARGWAFGTSGNFSAVLSRRPLRLAITPTGVDKGMLTPGQILEVDADGKPLHGSGSPSSDTALHLAIVRVQGAGAVLHTHSVWSTILSTEYERRGGICIEGYSMLKGLAGVRTHEHREWLPVIDDLREMTALAHRVERALKRSPDSHGLLLRGHGLYTWGRDLAEAKRHVEILEFLLEVLGRRLSVGSAAAAGSVRNRIQPISNRSGK